MSCSRNLSLTTVVLLALATLASAQDWSIENLEATPTVEAGSSVTVTFDTTYSGSEVATVRPRIALVLSASGVLSQGDYVLRLFPSEEGQFRPTYARRFQTVVQIPAAISSSTYSLEAVIDPKIESADQVSVQIIASSTPAADPTVGTPDGLNDLFAGIDATSPSADSLRSVPEVFDHLWVGLKSLSFRSGSFPLRADVPLASGLRRAKIAENSKALPMDRVFFNYNRFSNTLTGSLDGASRERSLSSFTLGYENSFASGLWSIEARAPFALDDSLTFDLPGPPGTVFQASAGELGNLSLFLKSLVWRNRFASHVAGIGVDTPTGSDALVAEIFPSDPAIQAVIRNRSVHLMPFYGVLYTPTCCTYMHAFAQADFAANGNPVVDVTGPGEIDLGKLNDVNLAHFDVAIGHWLYRRCRQWGRGGWSLSGLAAQVEYHLTSPLNDEDVVGDLAMDIGEFRSLRLDASDVTVGLHAQFARTTALRVGFAFPVGGDRPFDRELIVQFNRRFGS